MKNAYLQGISVDLFGLAASHHGLCVSMPRADRKRKDNKCSDEDSPRHDRVCSESRQELVLEKQDIVAPLRAKSSIKFDSCPRF